MNFISNFEKLNLNEKQIIKPYLTIINNATVKLKEGGCNLSCSYCIAKNEPDSKVNYVDTYYKWKSKIKIRNIILGNQREPFMIPDEVYKFLKDNTELETITVYTNGYSPDTQLEFVKKFPNLRIVRTYKNCSNPHEHNDLNILDHPNIFNQFMITPDTKLSTMDSVPNQMFKFLYDKNMDIQYKGSILQKDLLCNPDLINILKNTHGFEYHHVTDNMVQMYPNRKKPFLKFLDKYDTYNNPQNIVFSLSAYYDFLLYVAYIHQNKDLRSYDATVNDIRVSLYANIISNNPYDGIIDKHIEYYRDIYQNIITTPYNTNLNQLPLLCDFYSSFVDIHGYFDYYKDLFPKYDNFHSIDFVDFTTLSFTANDLLVVKFRDIIKGMNFYMVGLYKHIYQLLEAPYNFNLAGVKSSKNFNYLLRYLL